MSGCNCGRPVTVANLPPAKLGKLGTCRFCMFGTLALSLVGWIGFAAIAGDPAMISLRYTYLALAVASTLLFCAHIGAAAIRGAR